MRNQSRLTVLVATLSLIGAAGAARADDAARELWTKNCASCHGADGKAATKMGQMLKVNDLTDPAVRAKFDRERMIKAIKEGVAKEGGTTLAMPGYSPKLTDEQIGALVDLIQAGFAP
jgi:mono/diheme cytochrome c family protein